MLYLKGQEVETKEWPKIKLNLILQNVLKQIRNFSSDRNRTMKEEFGMHSEDRVIIEGKPG